MKKAATVRSGRRPVGRPRADEAPMQQIAIRLPRPMLDAIDALVSDRLDRPDRTAIMRELLAEAIAARSAKRKG